MKQERSKLLCVILIRFNR